MDSSRRPRGVVLVARPLALLIVAVALPALCCRPAVAAPLSDCNAHRGTIVAVDFAHWGGPIVRGCGIDQPTGYALLHAAGFTTAGDAHDGAAFVCRIGDESFHQGRQYPTPSEDACINTPSTSAYWAYYTAPAGRNTWSYSQLGAMGDVPHPGEVELWIFGGTNVAGTSGSAVPKFGPSTLRADAATTNTTTTTTTSRSSPTATTTTTGTSTSSTSTDTKAQPRRHHLKPRPRRRVRTVKRSTATASSTASAPAIVPAKPTSAHTSSGSALALVIGICLALALAAAGAWTAWRRRGDGEN